MCEGQRKPTKAEAKKVADANDEFLTMVRKEAEKRKMRVLVCCVPEVPEEIACKIGFGRLIHECDGMMLTNFVNSVCEKHPQILAMIMAHKLEQIADSD